MRVSPLMKAALVLVASLGPASCSESSAGPSTFSELDTCTCPAEKGLVWEVAELDCFCERRGCPEEGELEGWETFDCKAGTAYLSAALYAPTRVRIYNDGLLVGAYDGYWDPIECGASIVKAGDVSCLKELPESKLVSESPSDPPFGSSDSECSEQSGGAGGLACAPAIR